MMVQTAWISVFLQVIASVSGVPEVINLGGLFHSTDEIQKVAFKCATEMVQKDSHLLPNTTILTHMLDVPRYDSFQVQLKVCELMGKGISAVFGPQTGSTSSIVQSLCDNKEIPHVQSRWDYYQRRGSCLVNLYPHPSVLLKALFDVVEAWNWKSFTIIYENNDSILKVSELLKIHDSKGYPVVLRQLDADDNHRPVLRHVKDSGETNIVLDCSDEKLHEVLKQAQQVGLMGSEHSFIVTSLNLHAMDLEPFQYSGTNITGMRLFDPDDPQVQNVVRYWIDSELSEGRILDMTPEKLPVEAALIHDAVLLFAKAFEHLNMSEELASAPLQCEEASSWDQGYSVINYMKVSELKGLTGHIVFDHEGFRTNIHLQLIELTDEGLKQLGTWNTSEGLRIIKAEADEDASAAAQTEDLRNMTFIVITALTPPYGMLKESSHKLEGNDRFEGYGIDLIHELSLMSGFNYTFRIQADKSSGNPDPRTGRWSGMIGEVLEGRADLAIADLTITRERESAADFTLPFMNLGISILYKSPTKLAPSLFSFLSPFSNEVWIYMIAAYVGVSVLLFIMARISPYEWNNPYPCIKDPEELENQFSLLNSFWFTIGSLMQQGSEIAPIAPSTRMVAGIWWFFTLIMVSSYTANLAAFLTVEDLSLPFRNVEELANQNTIKYGAKAGGSTANFFRDSNHSTYQRMWQYMEANPEVMTNSNQEGVDRVVNEDYAFLMESTSIEYEVERKCQLSQVGGLLDNKGYGIVMRKNSYYRNVLSSNVLSLQEKGVLTQLKKKWWKEKRGGGACQSKDGGEEDATDEGLDLDNVGGVFVVLVAGVIVGVVLALVEMTWHLWRVSVNEHVSFKDEVIAELKFVAKFHGSTKPVRRAIRGSSRASSVDHPNFENGNTYQHHFALDDSKQPLD
nr:PREDICTED: glutamate receptor ionotropic, kainate 3-like [Bemisia tabaci]